MEFFSNVSCFMVEITKYTLSMKIYSAFCCRLRKVIRGNIMKKAKGKQNKTHTHKMKKKAEEWEQSRKKWRALAPRERSELLEWWWEAWEIWAFCLSTNENTLFTKGKVIRQEKAEIIFFFKHKKLFFVLRSHKK